MALCALHVAFVLCRIWQLVTRNTVIRECNPIRADTCIQTTIVSRGLAKPEASGTAWRDACAAAVHTATCDTLLLNADVQTAPFTGAVLVLLADLCRLAYGRHHIARTQIGAQAEKPSHMLRPAEEKASQCTGFELSPAR